MTQDRKMRMGIITLGFLAVSNIAVLILRYIRGDFLFVDFYARWQESAYLFRGINPFDALAGKHILSDIGVIDPDMVTVPWAWILGSFINPGFLPYSVAKIWGMCIYMIVILVTAAICYDYVRKNFFYEETEKNKRIQWCILAVLIVLSQYCWSWSFMCGNQGALACCFTVMAVCVYKKHPFWGGIFILAAMIKPQVAAIFLLTFFMLKEFKVLLTAFIGGILAFVAIYMQIHVGVIELLQGTLQVGTNLNYVFFGMFNMIKYCGISTNIILLLDMGVGIVYMVIITLQVKKNIGTQSMDIFMGAAIASTFWFYKQSHDYVILIIPCIVYLGQFYRQKKPQKILLQFIILCSFIGIFYLQSASRRFLSWLIPAMPEYMGKELFMTLTSIYFFIIGCYYAMNLKSVEDRNGEIYIEIDK